ncbi:MAG: hypothetical protein LQ350_005494 [Teloschistes chrysophthalmus]|nr:MAG: hypothetical protein LQ350_005494 [Niorma chrysophthalma]
MSEQEMTTSAPASQTGMTTPAAASQDEMTTPTPAMDLKLTRVFGPDGPTHTIALTNEQYHDLITQYMFVSNRRCQFLGFAGRLQTYLDRLARSTAERTRWVCILQDVQVADSLRLYFANLGGLVHKFREIGLRLQEIGMRVDDEIVWAGLA